MNILYLCDEYPPGRHGGIGTAVQLLAREMVKQGHNVVVAGFYDWGYGEQNEFVDQGVKVYRFRRGLATSLLKDQYSIPVRIAYKLLNITGIFHRDIVRSLKKYHVYINNLVRQHDIHIIEQPDYNDYIRFCKSYVPLPKFDRPSVVKLHGSLTHIAKGNNVLLPEFITRFEADVLHLADSVCAVSKYAAEKAKDYFGYDKPVAVLPNGIDTEGKAVSGIKKPMTAIFTGALTENKGIYQLMKAWNIVYGRLPQARLDVFGKGPIAKVKAFLSADAQGSVIFHGHVSRTLLFKELSEASLAVLPSYSETFGMATLEAMLAKTAVIYTERTSGPELIDHEVDGLLTDPDDTEKMADQICYLLQAPEVCKAFAEKALEKVYGRFDISVIAKKHIVYYSSVLNLKTIVSE